MLNEERPLLVKRWPEMAAKIQKRLLGEGKITKEMIESYVDAYAGIYGDDTDAYVEEIVADTYAGMKRTERLITLNLANDIWEIANESRYENSKGEFKQTRMHESSERWHYFVNAINYVDDAQPVGTAFTTSTWTSWNGMMVISSIPSRSKKEEPTPPGLSLPGLTAKTPPT